MALYTPSAEICYYVIEHNEIEDLKKQYTLFSIGDVIKHIRTENIITINSVSSILDENKKSYPIYIGEDSDGNVRYFSHSCSVKVNND